MTRNKTLLAASAARASVAAVLVLALIGAPAPAGAKCARVFLAPQALTHRADVIPVGGGVLVGWRQTTDDAAERYLRDGDPALHRDWRFTVRKRRVKAVVESLAPGLAVYRPAAIKGGKAETIVLAEKDGTRVGTYKLSRKKRGFTAAAPVAARVTVLRTTGHRWGDDVIASVELSAAPPAGAHALILYRDDQPLSWASVKGVTTTTLRIYESEGHCGRNPDGMAAPAPGDQVTLAWVDGFGRRSARSAAIAVEAGIP